ncbi:MAG: trimethylamine methyltransferase, partial [Gemmatimonadales bacterium]|nr:trimethylamine methyltransferase [Gemmatimonadales bacterium]
TVMSYGAPEMTLLSAGMTDITKWLRLPMFSTAGCGDAKVLDQQAAIEATISIAVAALSGANLVHDVGYLESGLVGSYDMLVMSDEVIGMVKRIMGGVVVDDGHLAVQVIDRVGPGGNFLADDHTLEHYRREFWQPELLDRSRREAWETAGSKTLRQRVRERVLDLIENFEPTPLDPAVERKLQGMCHRADTTYAGDTPATLT